MKNSLTLLACVLGLLFSFKSWSQNNHTINYQAVAHSNNGTTINNTNIDVEISISSDTTISPEFEESHSVSTNEYGLFSLKIGSINSVDFEEIEWAEEAYYLGLTIDGEQMGYQLLVSVPYSFTSIEALNAETVNGNTVESNVPANAVFTDEQKLSLDSDSLYISNGNAIALDNISTNDNDWTISSNNMYSSNSGKVGIGITNFTNNPGKLNITTDANTKRGLYIINNTSGNATNFGKFGVYAMVSGGGTGDNQGGWFDANGQGTGINYGVAGNATGSAGENRGVYGAADNGTSNWAGYFGDDNSPGSGNVKINDQLVIGSNSAAGSFQLKDGFQGAGKILTSDSNGSAQWTSITTFGPIIMLKSNYDSNTNNIVDNAENAQLINGYQVGTNVPQNADFTDDQNANEVNYNNNISGLTANNTQAAIDELNNNIGNSGNMHTTNYDANQNGIVDTAETINGFQVNSNVPPYAIFSDNQTLSSNGLDAANVVRIEISNGNYVDVNLSALNNSGSDNQDLTGASFDNVTNVLTIDIQNGNSVAVNLSDLVNTDNQNLSLSSDDSLFISNGNGIDLSPFANQVNNDNDPANEIQTLSFSNNTLSLSDGGGTISVPNYVYIDGSNVGVATNFSSSGDFNTATGLPSLTNISSGSGNSAYGDASLINTSTGSSNSAYGRWSLGGTTTGSSNAGLGIEALKTNTTGSDNSAFGAHADVSSGNLTNATAIGANAVVSQSNSLVLGNDANVGIGTSSPSVDLEIQNNSPELRMVSSQTNSLANTYIRFGDLSSGSFTENGWIGMPGSGNYLELGSPNAIFFNTNYSYNMVINQSGNIGIGTTTPSKKLDVNGDTKISGKLAIGSGSLSSAILGSFGGSWYLGDDSEDPKITIDGDKNGISWSIGVDDQSNGGGSGNADFIISGGGDLNSPKLTIDNNSIKLGSSFNGNDYEINTPSGGNANMIPIAYGSIHKNGTKYNCSDNVSSANYSNGTWTIAINGLSFHYLNCTAVISPVNNSQDPVLASFTSLGGNLLVKLYGVTTGSFILGNGFTFVIYKN